MRRHLVLPTLLVLLASTGCGDVDRALNGVDGEAERRNAALLQRAGDQLEQRFDLVRVDAGYTDSITSAGLAVLDVACRGCDEDAVAAQAERLVWLSEVDPLVTISVSVSDLADVREARAGGAVAQERDRLIEQYGERPVPDGG